MIPFLSRITATRRLTRMIWRRLRGRRDLESGRILESGVRATPLAEILDSLEATAAPKRRQWWPFGWLIRGRRVKRPARVVSRTQPQRRDGRRRFGTAHLAAAEPLEMRLALSTTWVDPQHEIHAQSTAVNDTSSPYTFRLGTSDLDLSSHADLLQGRDVVVVADETAGGELGNVVIGSLSGLASLDVRAPAGVTVNVGQPLLLAVEASGGSPRVYQWRRGDTVVAGATGAQLRIPAAAAGDAGTYVVVVSNAAGSAVSPAADHPPAAA